MNLLRRLLYVAGFVALAVTAALVAGRVADPAIRPLLLVTVAAATLAGAPGIVRRRAWPLALILLPLAAYLLARAQVSAPPHTGIDDHLAFYVRQLRAGALAYANNGFPLEVATKAGLRLLLSLAVYAAVGVAAFFALSLRRPVPAIAVLLILAGFGFTVDDSSGDLWAALVFLLLAGSMLVLSRALQRQRWGTTDAFAGGVTAALAALLALSIMGTTMVEAGTPLQDWHTWDIAGPESTILSFDWMENYPRLLDPDEDGPVMRVYSPIASYWRANVLSEFTGTTWQNGTLVGRDLRSRPRGEAFVYEVPPTQPAPRGRLATERFVIGSTYTTHLFTGGWAREVRLFQPADLEMTDASAFRVDTALGPAFEYSVAAVVPALAPADLIGRGRSYPAEVQRLYSALPFPSRQDVEGPSPEAAWRIAAATTQGGREWAGLYRLNEQIIGAQTDPYGIALAIEQFLRSRYDYSLEPPSVGFASPYAEFLFVTRTGYCQHFAGAMAALLRFNGIPARVAVGFTAGKEEEKGVFVVTRSNSHAWVEAYFPGVGWAPFEPTPGRRLPDAGDAPPGGPDAAAGAGLDAAGASPTAAPKSGARGRARVADPSGPVGQAGDTRSTSGWRPWGIALVVVLVGWPAGRALLRRRGLLGDTREARLSSSVSLLYADLRDHGVDVPPSQTLEETARYLDEHLDVNAGELTARVQAVEFGGRAATDADLDEVATLRRRVHRRLRARMGWRTAVLALYGVRPAGLPTAPRP